MEIKDEKYDEWVSMRELRERKNKKKEREWWTVGAMPQQYAHVKPKYAIIASDIQGAHSLHHHHRSTHLLHHPRRTGKQKMQTDSGSQRPR